MRTASNSILPTAAILLQLLLPSYASALFLDAEVVPQNPQPSQQVAVTVFDDPGCEPLGPDANGITHEVNVVGTLIELDLVFADVCASPSGEIVEHEFDIGELDAGNYQLRIYDNTGNIFPTNPEDRELLYEESFGVGEILAVPAFSIFGVSILILCMLMLTGWANRSYLGLLSSSRK